MHTTESIEAFSFNPRGLEGLDPAERAGLRRYLAQRERAINRVALLTLRCAGGPLNGQQITLEHTGNVQASEPRSTDLALRGMRGFYRASKDGSAALWTSTEPAPDLKYDIETTIKVKAQEVQDLETQDTASEQLPAATATTPATPKASPKPLPKTHSRLAVFLGRIQTGQADQFIDPLGNPCPAEDANADHFAVFRIYCFAAPYVSS